MLSLTEATRAAICAIASVSTVCSASVRRRVWSAWLRAWPKISPQAGDGRLGLLRRAGRLLGRSPDLLQRPAQFLRRGRRFGHAARQLLGGRAQAFGGLFLS